MRVKPYAMRSPSRNARHTALWAPGCWMSTSGCPCRYRSSLGTWSGGPGGTSRTGQYRYPVQRPAQQLSEITRYPPRRRRRRRGRGYEVPSALMDAPVRMTTPGTTFACERCWSSGERPLIRSSVIPRALTGKRLPSAQLTRIGAADRVFSVLFNTLNKCIGVCRFVRGIPVGTGRRAADLWDFCGARKRPFDLPGQPAPAPGYSNPWVLVISPLDNPGLPAVCQPEGNSAPADSLWGCLLSRPGQRPTDPASSP